MLGLGPDLFFRHRHGGVDGPAALVPHDDDVRLEVLERVLDAASARTASSGVGATDSRSRATPSIVAPR
ncbi:MAG: hypothetical protein LC800_23370 [Acidobacteria bacterium]|nr:hypothetical protein [Acidobacteriota bacterium]